MSTLYEAPHIPELLTISSLLYIIAVAETICDQILNAGLLGPLIIGILAGPVANLLSVENEHLWRVFGYIGLIMIVFEAGLYTDISLLLNNIPISMTAAITGVCMPIALSFLLLQVGYGYTSLHAFSAGASLCSTSLGTTLSLLTPTIKKSRLGVVLINTALFDDIAGLVMASVIAQLAASTASFSWQIVGRPVLVSFGFTFVVPLLAYLFGKIPYPRHIFIPRVQLFIIIATLSGFVAGANYAGTSELYGAYLAGAFLAHVFTKRYEEPESTEGRVGPRLAFERYLVPVLKFTSPIFFSSIGTAIPFLSLWHSRVIWRGMIYSILMVLGKMIVGICILIWQDEENNIGWFGRKRIPPAKIQPVLPGASEDHPAEKSQPAMSRIRGSLFVGLAMVARGEIALIVVQIARPLLVENGSETSEQFTVVIFAILVTTIVGAVGVGFVLRGVQRSPP